MVAADAEAVLVADLNQQFAQLGWTDAAAGTTIADPRPAGRYARVRLSGGSSSYFTSGPMVVIECWADKKVTARDFGAITEGLVESLPDRLGICSGVTDVGSLGFQPDPDSGTPRYVFTKVLHLRKRVL